MTCRYSDDLLLMSTPPTTKDRTPHPAARALADKLAQDDGPTTDNQTDGNVDKILACSPFTTGTVSKVSSKLEIAHCPECPGKKPLLILCTMVQRISSPILKKIDQC